LFVCSAHNSAGMKPVNVCNCSGSIETDMTGVAGMGAEAADVTGVLVSEAVVTGILCAAVVATKFENDASVSATDVLLPVCKCTSWKLFQSRMFWSPGKSRIEFMLSSSSTASCDAKRPSNSAAHVVSDSLGERNPEIRSC
jgi:hypothetical protein